MGAHALDERGRKVTYSRERAFREYGKPVDQSGVKTNAPSGGKFKRTEWGWPCIASGSA